MSKNFDFKFIGYDGNLGKKVLSKLWLIDSDWEKNTHRQNSQTYNKNQLISPHKKTKSVPLIFDETHKFLSIKYHEKYFLFENELNYLLNFILNPFYNTNGMLLRAMFVKLLQNSTIEPHIDLGQNMNITNRIHFPIKTNDNCLFISGKTTKNLKQFEVWEINNAENEHSVINNSLEDRIHLIVDYLPVKIFEEYSKYEYL